jgi:opacity protein-like surface antigen
MRRLTVTSMVAALALSSGVAWAQAEVELVPFAGYRWGGGLTTISGIRDFDTKDTWSFGAALDKTVPKGGAVELYYAYYATDVSATIVGGPSLTKDMTRQDIMINGLAYSPSAYGPTRPYFSLGLGASIFSSEGLDTQGRFAWSLGLGVRHDMSEKMGFRIDGRWMPTWITTGSGVWCDPFYGCYNVGTGESYDQFELSLGLIIKPGN